MSLIDAPVRPAAAAMRLRVLAARLGGFAYRFGDEVQLHGILADVLIRSGEFGFIREYAANKKDRFDFWFGEEGLVIEVKVDGSLSAALRQIDRYTQVPTVRGVLLAHTPSWSEVEISSLRGVPVLATHLQRQCL